MLDVIDLARKLALVTYGRAATSLFDSFSPELFASGTEEIRRHRGAGDQCTQRWVVGAVFLRQRLHRHKELVGMRQLVAGESFVMVVLKPIQNPHLADRDDQVMVWLV